jgi:uncharacterized protein with GYD domain
MESKSLRGAAARRRLMQPIWEDIMPLYITRGNYTGATIKNMMAKPEDRTETVGKLFAAVGGKLHALYFTFGESDFLLIAEAPSEKDIMAVLLAAAGTGAVTNLNTVAAVSAADAKAVFAKANTLVSQYRPPGT